MRFGSTRESRTAEICGFLGEGVEIHGEIRFKETLRVDGKAKGTFVGEGELVVGPAGEIEGDVTVGTLSVSGHVTGTLRIKEKLEVHAGGRVEGEVLLGRPGLTVHDGGVVEAKIQMGTAHQAEPGAGTKSSEQEATEAGRAV